MIDTLLHITIPDNNVNEREYACSILFNTLLEIPYSITTENSCKDTIVKVGDRRLIIEDHFFNVHPSPLTYIHEDNIPDNVKVFHDHKGNCVPMIYGEDTLTITEKEIYCGNDVVAGVFFLVSRWEEFLHGRQETGKCDEQLLYLVKNNVHSIPLVHVYEKLIKEFISILGYKTDSNRQFSIVTTHDVDRCYLTGWVELFKNVRNLFKQGESKSAKKLLHDYIWYKRNCPKPFDTYDFFMDCSDKFHTQDCYFFKTCVEGEKGFTYAISDNVVREMAQKVVERGHVLGFHPSESTFGNFIQFKEEFKRLETIGGSICAGRNHGLFCNTLTYHQWEEAGAHYVSNYGFQHRNGFRCGICVPYPLYDVFERKQMGITELPFELMDTVLLRNKPSYDVALSEMKDIVDRIAENGGILCMNWHTNVYNMPDIQEYRSVYTDLLEYAKQKMD